ncbi:MAG: DUF1295 domain-containing protein [Clostridia bacterium]|nr:DUF1295 domain-containing protein [Clostridia bacterium]
MGFKRNRSLSFFAILLIYVAAAAVGAAAFYALPGRDLLPRLFTADVAATLLVWLFGILLGNSSVYDPYWSVAPMVMAPFAAAYIKALSPGVLLLLGVILLWGIRLTLNWAFTFQSLNMQDWRYTQLREAHPKLWFIINLFGIHLFPTAVVFFVMIPAFLFTMDFTGMNFGIVASACLCVFAVALQATADAQMRRFKQSAANAGRVNRVGLWKYIRHPNYLGEILMWWGIYFMLLCARPDLWAALIGPLANTLMFVNISIPLMENRQLRDKPEYSEYQAGTGMLLPKFF